VSGSNVYFAGGGGGGQWLYNFGGSDVGTGGIGGGGDAGGANQDGYNAASNTGGGAGGGSANNINNVTGGNGGSGVVILRYPSSYSISETTSGGNVLTFNTYTEGSDNVTVFTSGENGTIQFS